MSLSRRRFLKGLAGTTVLALGIRFGASDAIAADTVAAAKLKPLVEAELVEGNPFLNSYAGKAATAMARQMDEIIWVEMSTGATRINSTATINIVYE